MRLWWTSLIFAVAGCGGAARPAEQSPQSPPPAQAPAEQPATEPTGPAPSAAASELQALEHELAVSAQQLEQALALRKRAARVESESADEGGPPAERADDDAAPSPPSSAGAPARPRRQPAPKGGAPAPRDAEARAAGVSAGCELACRALASMRSAAQGICRLTGDAAPECTRARERVHSAEQRVRSARCACEGEQG